MDSVDRICLDAEHLLAVRRFDDALARVEDGLANAPGHAPLHVLLGRIHLAADRPDEAADAGRRAVELGSRVPALRLVAQAERRRRRWDEAEAAIDAAIADEPEWPGLHVTRTLILAGRLLDEETSSTAESGIAEARQSASHARSLGPSQPGPDYASGLVELAADDLPAAAAFLQDAVAKDPEWSDAHHLLGVIRDRQGMGRLASRHHAAAGALDPRNDAPLRELRRLARPARGVAGAGVVAFLAAVIAALSPLAGLAALVLGAMAILTWRRLARRRPDLDNLVPEAARIVEADLALRGSDG